MEKLQDKLDEFYFKGEKIRPEIEYKLPIEYVDHHILTDIIRNDLELGKDQSLYTHLFSSNSTLMNKWSSIYTTDTKFLKQTQKCIKRYNAPSYACEPFRNQYSQFISETNFIDKYQFISFKCLEHLNQSSGFLHCLSLYNLTSPVFSLLSPLLILLLPFTILKIQKVPITIESYISHLKKIFKGSSVYQLFFNFSSVSLQNRISAFFSLFIYVLQVYNNIISCYSFYRNINSIYSFLIDYKVHLQQTLHLLDDVTRSISGYSTYNGFMMELREQRRNITDILAKANQIDISESIVTKITQIGRLMSLYYDFFMNETNHQTLQYTFFIHEFNLDLLSIQKLVKSKKINPCKYKKKTAMKGLYYLPHLEDKNIKNEVDLKNNLLISGPNASGKTTLLKSVFLNVIMSQQFGYGCYDKATVSCYDIFHSYLNIPDTSGRDSLFQAEARRCKEILDSITDHPEKKHLCIFDEIYSGTNPNDAVTCAKLYLNGLNLNKSRVDYLITTHYIELCEHFKEKESVLNQKMDVTISSDKIEYTYKMVEGISYVNGGIFILRELDYPTYLYESV